MIFEEEEIKEDSLLIDDEDSCEMFDDEDEDEDEDEEEEDDEDEDEEEEDDED